MNEPFEWHDVCSKSAFTTLEETMLELPKIMPMMLFATEAVFRRKLASGYEAVSPLRMDYVKIVDNRGNFYIETRYVAMLREKKNVQAAP